MTGKKQFKSYADNPFQFTEVLFDATHEDAFERWIKAEAPTEMEAIEHFTGAGFSVKFTLGMDGDTPAVSVTRVNDTYADYNRCFTSWGEDLADCLLLALYKHAVLLEGGLLPEGGKRKDKRRR